MNTPRNPDHPDRSDDSAWEAAMSRDFDARVRGLHEAPLDIGSVKGKARTIRRTRRAAVAGGVLGVAAIITPVAVLASNGDPDDSPPDFAPSPSQTVSDPAGTPPEHVVDGVWHQPDGDEVELPQNEHPYDAAVLWGDLLVATRFGGEVFSVADVIGQDGEVVDSFDVAGTVVATDAGTAIAWVDPDGTVWTDSAGGPGAVGSVDMAAPGETLAWSAAAVIGGPDCSVEADGCLVYVNNHLDQAPTAVSPHLNQNPIPEALDYRDVTADGTAAIVTRHNEDGSVCSGIGASQGPGGVRDETCDFLVEDISPDGRLVAAIGSYQSGAGPTSISVLTVDGLEETPARYAPEGGHIGTWAWNPDGRLMFDVYDGASWRLWAMEPSGETEEIGSPVRGDEFDSPFLLIQR